MDSWLQDELMGSWEQAYAEGDNPGCIMGFDTLINSSSRTAYPIASAKPKKHKKKKKSKKKLLEQKLIDELGASPKDKDLNDEWFLEWLGVTPKDNK